MQMFMDINNQGQSYQGLINQLKGQSPAAANSQSRLVDSLSFAGDRVSVSYKGNKLSMISAEYFNGPMSSKDIPALTERLYQDGLISATEYKALGGVAANESPSQVAQSINFLNSFILSEGVDGDTEGAKNLLNAVDALEQMNNRPTAETRRKETEAYEYLSNYTDLLKEAQAPADLVAEFDNVLQVFEALDQVRKQEQQNGAIASYASVQEVYNENNNKLA
jgi:hypothetical protein